MKLSERLEAAVERLYEDGMDTQGIADLFRESAELARRVEDATVGRRYARSKNDWLVTPDEEGGVAIPYQRVLIVPVQEEE